MMFYSIFLVRSNYISGKAFPSGRISGFAFEYMRCLVACEFLLELGAGRKNKKEKYFVGNELVPENIVLHHEIVASASHYFGFEKFTLLTSLKTCSSRGKKKLL